MRDLQLQNCRLSQRYDIRELLGRGSYAEIYVARDSMAAPNSPHEFVVIKALNVYMQNDLDPDLERTLVENFQNEAIALDNVRHPNTISRLGHGTARDLRGTVFHYLVLEYMPGGDLSKYCQNQRLSVARALDYLEQVCSGISHAHKKNVIHRDIKPQNLLLTAEQDIVKIADFGVARFGHSESPITRVGTNIYAPPEHSPMLAGKTQELAYNELTPAADVYSLAKSTYVLFTSESPRYFANHPVTELPFSFRQEPWADELTKVLNRATQNDPRNRFQDINDFWNELSKLRYIDEEVSLNTRISAKRSAAPQPHFAKGYSPNTPVKPKFNTSRDLKLKPHLTIGQNPPLVVEINEKNPLLKPARPPVLEIPPAEPAVNNLAKPEVHRPRKNFFRAAAVFVILVGLFAGSLYATYNYLVGTGFSFFGSQSVQLGTATSDINLRETPDTTREAIGLVTRNSRVEVVNIQNNWYQIVIIQHGRPKADPRFADRGWAHGRYINLDD